MTTATMPGWLIRHLEQTGVLDSDGIRRTAAYGRCPRCAARILTGLDSERCALVARVDPWPIDRMSEFMAIATGRFTYNLTRSATSSGKRCWNIDHRYAEQISGNREWIVVAEHRCGAPLPASDTIPTHIPARTDPHDPPF